MTEFKQNRLEAFQDTSKICDMMQLKVALTEEQCQPTSLLHQTKSLEGDLENNNSWSL